MKFFHLSDLHIGKQLHHYNLKEDQIHILKEILRYANDIRPDAIVIAGDIYDKSVPSAEAVTIFDEFLTDLSKIQPKIPVLVIAGNHDSAERLQYASRLLSNQQVYMVGTAPKEEEKIAKVTLIDDYGKVHFYLLPFFKPGYIKGALSEVPASYEEGLDKLLSRETINQEERNVFVSHQFYTGNGTTPVLCDSETIYVGGIDNIHTNIIAGFDYVALGHIHGAQSIGHTHIRYCGTLLKYSVSEAAHEKTLSVVTLGEKGQPVIVEQMPLHPLRDVKKKVGSIEELLQVGKMEQDFVSLVLTDEVEPYNPKERLEEIYSHILEIRIDNKRTRKKLQTEEKEINIKDPISMFGEFFEEIQGRVCDEKELAILETVLEETRGEAYETN